MATINKKGQTPLKTAKSNTTKKSSVEIKVPRLTVHIFFDGTKNNMFNVGIKRGESFGNNHAKNLTKSKPADEVISYANYLSNIALLYMTLDTDNLAVTESIYVEGAGSAKYQTDYWRGTGTAGGVTGISARCAWAFDQLKRLCKGVSPANVTLNVYGFSRGAAWARHFCYKLKSDGGDWSDTEKDSAFKKVKINFVGIFDTVSSDTLNHYDDVSILGLDIGKPQGINYIAHFTAQNDYRYHFPLTPIKGAIKDGIGFECSMPGAHSDIGGGYPEKYYEKKTLKYIQVTKGRRGEPDSVGIKYPTEYIDYKWFLKKGYYQKTTTENNNVVAERTTEFHYQFIGYELMKYIATKKAGYRVHYKSGTIYKNISIYSNNMTKRKHLGAFYAKCINSIKVNYKRSGSFKVPTLGDTAMQAIYHNYIHNSLSYGEIGNNGGLNNKVNNKANNPTRPLVKKGFR